MVESASRRPNLGGSVGNYTAEQFKEEYPQFCNADGKCHLPDALLNEIVRMANVSVQPDKWLDSWHYARGAVCGTLRDPAAAHLC